MMLQPAEPPGQGSDTFLVMTAQPFKGKRDENTHYAFIYFSRTLPDRSI